MYTVAVQVVFTSGATAALKLAGECFPWSPEPHQGRTTTSTSSSSTSSSASSSVCYYPVSSHNSLLGVVQLAAAAGARLAPFQVQPDGSCTLLPPPDSSSFCRTSSGSRCSSTRNIGRQQQQQQQQQQREQEEEQQEGVQEAQGDTAVTHHLVLLPAECNFSGQRLSAAQVTDILQQLQQQAQAQAVSRGSAHAEPKQQQEEQPQDLQQQPSMQQQQQQQQGGRVDRWVVVLDAAKACTSHPPDLATCPADMVALSHYKIFGHPTGLGALVVKRDLLPELTRRKVYFGGGTVEVSVPQEAWYIRWVSACGIFDVISYVHLHYA
jgi:molybdenum cofactor sulfurtransferase